MTLSLKSGLFSLLINSTLLLLLITGLTFTRPKKEEVKITLLEPAPSAPREVKVDEETKSSILKESIPEENKVLKSREAFPRSQPKNLARVSSERSKEKSVDETYLEEALLKARLAKLKEKTLSEASRDEEEFLKKRISQLKNKGGEKGQLSKGDSKSEGLEKAPPSTSSEGVSSLSRDYLLLVKRKLQTHFEVPIYLKGRGDLKALVEIEVNERGEIQRVTFLQKAQDPEFNRAVERCLRAVNPLPVNQRARLRIEFRGEGLSIS